MSYVVRWIQNVRERAAVLGQHQRAFKQNILRARSNCRNKRFEKVDPELQYRILTRFNNLGSKEREDQYLNGTRTTENI